jgi:hypothetical protein
VPITGRKIGGGSVAATVCLFRTENHHDYCSLGFVP